jgi:hypothetical protein
MIGTLILLALLVQKYKYCRFAPHFICFTGTKVQILTLCAAPQRKHALSLLALLVQKTNTDALRGTTAKARALHFTCFTGTKVQILTLCAAPQRKHALSLLALLVQKYKY